MIESEDQRLDFWDEVLSQLENQIADTEVKGIVEAFRQAGRIKNRFLNGLFGKLDKAGLSIVLLLDELEHLADNSNFGANFFYGLRSLALNHRLALVTTSQTELHNLSLSDDKSGASPFFNIFDIIYLGSFNPDEVDQFFDHYLAGTDIQFSTEDRDFLRTLAGLHPYYLTIGGSLLFDASLNLPSASPERLPIVLRRFSDKAEGALRYSWSHTNEVEKIYLTILALLYRESGETPASFSRKRLTNYYYTTDRALDRLIRRGLVIEQKGNVGIFSSVFAQWIRNELRETRPSLPAYHAWLNFEATQNRLKYIKKNVVDQVTVRLLPIIKPHYRDWVMNWLMNASHLKSVVKLLLLLAEESDGDQLGETVVKPLIMTEGKTDWKHLKSALKKLKEAGHYASLEIEFSEYEDDLQMGSNDLKNLCQHASKIVQLRPLLCIFDRDEARIIKQVSDANQAYKDWGGNVFSFIIPVPDHRVTTPNISIEFYYTDAEIKRLDKQGRRLFLSDEFHPSSRHKRDDLTCTDLSKIKRKDVSIIDDRVFDGDNKNVALPKSQFADYIRKLQESFNDFEVSEFQKIFDIIVMIIEENDLT
jgi:hypothetical protein